MTPIRSNAVNTSRATPHHAVVITQRSIHTTSLKPVCASLRCWFAVSPTSNFSHAQLACLFAPRPPPAKSRGFPQPLYIRMYCPDNARCHHGWPAQSHIHLDGIGPPHLSITLPFSVFERTIPPAPPPCGHPPALAHLGACRRAIRKRRPPRSSPCQTFHAMQPY